MKHLFGQHIAYASDCADCATIDIAMENLSVDANNQRERQIAPSYMLGRIMQSCSPSKFLEADEVWILALEFKGEIRLCFISVVRAIVDDGW
jgi:hypothetical protein